MVGCVTRLNRDAARKVLGTEDEPSDDADFNAADPQSIAGSVEWKARIDATMLTRTSAQWVAALDAAGVPATVVHFPEQMADDPQVQAMGMFAELEHEITGKQRLVGPLLRMSKTPPVALLPAPTLGGHSDEVLREGGVSEAEIAELRAAGVVA